MENARDTELIEEMRDEIARAANEVIQDAMILGTLQYDHTGRLQVEVTGINRDTGEEVFTIDPQPCFPFATDRNDYDFNRRFAEAIYDALSESLHRDLAEYLDEYEPKPCDSDSESLDEFLGGFAVTNEGGVSS